MKKTILTYFLLLLTVSIFAGCATWDGIKQDTGEAYDATKEAIHEATE